MSTFDFHFAGLGLVLLPITRNDSAPRGNTPRIKAPPKNRFACLAEPIHAAGQVFCILLAGVLLTGSVNAQMPESPENLAQFQAVEIYVDTKDNHLAAYQIEFNIKNGQAKIVGIEGGEHSAFKEPPYYDPKAIQKERVIIAAFNTAPADQLPIGKTRVARIHLFVTGTQQPQYDARLQTAASSEGNKIQATITCQIKETE